MPGSDLSQWNANQKVLRASLGKDDAAIDLLLTHHAQTHRSGVNDAATESFADGVWADLREAQFRCIPPGGEHSIAWCMWHLARIEDTAMNILVAGSPQLLHSEGWNARLNIDIIHCGNAMPDDAMADLSATIDMNALRDYRMAVGRRTQLIMQALPPENLPQKVDAARIQRVLDEGALQPEAVEIAEYWRKRTIAGLFLMPATRHNMVHINEALRIKKKCR